MPRITVKFEIGDVVAARVRGWVLGEVETIDITEYDTQYKMGGREEWFYEAELKLTNRRAERHDED